MDATRSDLEFTAEVLQIALDEGATTINVPDTVGYSMPDEYAAMWRDALPARAGPRDVTDLGALPRRPGPGRGELVRGRQAGCRQVECAINGIGERAGNASLEEIVMLLRVREADARPLDRRRHARDRAHEPHGVAPHRLPGAAEQGDRRAQRLRARVRHPPGRRAEGAHHLRDHGRHHDRARDELDRARQALRPPRAAQRARGARLPGRRARALNTAFKRFKELADKKKKVTALDLEAIVSDEMRQAPAAFELESFDIEASSTRSPLARVARAAAGRRGRAGAASPATARSTRSSARSTRPRGHEARLKEFHV